MKRKGPDGAALDRAMDLIKRAARGLPLDAHEASAVCWEIHDAIQAWRTGKAKHLEQALGMNRATLKRFSEAPEVLAMLAAELMTGGTAPWEARERVAARYGMSVKRLGRIVREWKQVYPIALLELATAEKKRGKYAVTLSRGNEKLSAGTTSDSRHATAPHRTTKAATRAGGAARQQRTPNALPAGRRRVSRPRNKDAR